ncbi:MAG: pitrilysin family protein [Bacteroidales bacterium]|nr:pitrilysin family protein [Bacteroidales bacterium]
MSDFRSIKPMIFPLQALQIPDIESTVLSNGVRLQILKDMQMELIRFDIKFSAGVRYQTKMFLASFTAKMLFEGTRKYSSEEISEMFDSKGAYYGVSPELDHVNVVFYIPKLFFEDLLPIISEVLFDAVFPEDDLIKLQKKEKMSLRVNMTKSSVLARFHFRNVLFGDHHPYGLFPVLENIQNISKDDLSQFHHEFYMQNPFKLYLTGAVDDEIKRAVERSFGNVQVKKDAVKEKEMFFETKSDVDVVLPDAVQRSLRLGQLTVHRTHPDFVDLGVLSTVLGGYFGSRLMTNVREEKGYTYGIGSSIVSLQDASYLAVYSDVGKDVWELALKEIILEMERLCNEKVEHEELERVKQYIAGSMFRSMDGAVNMIEKFIDLDNYGLSFDFLQKQMESVHAIDEERLQTLAQKYLKPADFVKVVVG